MQNVALMPTHTKNPQAVENLWIIWAILDYTWSNGFLSSSVYPNSLWITGSSRFR